MKLFVGLGNPGKDYENTRHNAGFKFIDFLAHRYNVTFSSKFSSLFAEAQGKEGEKLMFLKPQTFMNDSGRGVVEIMKFYKISPDNVHVAFDDLDIKLGEFKVQKGHYPKVHNGVNDIINKTATDQFIYIRIGIDGRSPIEREFVQGKSYVLQKFDYNLTPVFGSIMQRLGLLSQ